MLTDRFDQAVLYAIELHRAQMRTGTSIPYVTHLFAVCSLVLEDGGTEDEAIAALLHDGPEDQGGIAVLDQIRAGGPRAIAFDIQITAPSTPAEDNALIEAVARSDRQHLDLVHAPCRLDERRGSDLGRAENADS